ncbi:MAG: peptide chain release factor N(5)-glutamine methyltransferase [Fibromonadaceae bacterium]|jgi:release factor glutamine methyltransferase|nr:peptide chain release factor N(5)-glutamine methyltransferase [Fibromonadaceae bacterium]
METILSILNKTTDFLQKHGVPNAKLDSQLLLSHGLGMKRMDLFLNFDRPLQEAELAKLRPMVARRVKREPLQHILGSVSFRGHEIKCDKRALIPRQETELIVDILCLNQNFQNLNNSQNKIIDVGTGSGAIAVAVALELGVQVFACDVSEEALSLARENVALHNLEDKISLIHSDLLSALPNDVKLDALLANLPYIPNGDLNTLEIEVKDYDPHSALFGGMDGLDIIRKLLNTCADYLKPNAPVILEIASGQEKILQKENFAGLEWVEGRKDYNGQARFAIFSTLSL